MNIKREFIFRILRLSGIPYFFRCFLQRRKVTILLFHDIDKDAFVRAYLYLSKKYNIIDLNEYIAACREAKENIIPKRALIITFDDGHIGNHDLLPVIKKYNVPMTIFLCASIVGTKREFWFKFARSSMETIENLKLCTNKERLRILHSVGYKQEDESNQAQALDRQQISEMRSYVNFQSQTLFHPCLPNCEYSDAKREIFDSKLILEKDFGLVINSISYPNGDYTDREIALVKKAGYECGITVDYGFNDINSDLYRLKRVSVNDTTNIDELIVKASGCWAFFKSRLWPRKS